MKTTHVPPRQKLHARLAFALLLGVIMLAGTTQHASAALSNTLTWTGGTSTNAAVSTNYSVSPAFGGANVFNMSNSIYLYVYTNTASYQVGTATFTYGNSNIGGLGFQFLGYDNVVVTNLGGFRLDTSGVVASNASGTGTVYIYNNANSNNQLTGNALFGGNMSVFLGALANHSSTARTLSNNLNSFALSNLVVNSMSQTTIGGSGNTTTLTWAGTGTGTILGSIGVVAQTNVGGTSTNAGALIVTSGRLNIATTNAANIAASTGWNSGLVITNSGSVFVAGQNSLGTQAYNIKIGTTNGGTTTFGLFDTNVWATNSATTVALTNNFDILNAASASATNIFQSVAGKTLTLSGVIGSTNTNGTLLFLNGTTVLSGANTFSNVVVVSNSTLRLSNTTALGVTNAGTTVAGTTGALDLNGQTIGAEAVALNNSSAPSLLNSSATAASLSGAVTLGADTTISNTGDVTLSGGISGSYALTKAGAATATLSAASSYTGTTTISGGALRASNASALGTNGLTVANGATLAIAAAVSKNNITNNGTISIGAGSSLLVTNLAGTGGALSLSGTAGGGNGAIFTNNQATGTTSAPTVLNVGSITLGGYGTIAFANAYNKITTSSGVTISGTNNLISIAGSWDTGSYNLLTAGTALSASGLSLTNATWSGSAALGATFTNGRTTYLFDTNALNLFMTVGGGAGDITWSGGASGLWNTDVANTPWTNNSGGTASAFYTGDNVTLSTAGSTITLTNVGVTAGTVTGSAASGTITLTGGSLTNTGLTQSGNGTLLLSNNVVVAGTETVSAGTLSIASGATNTASTLNVSGGTLTNVGNLAVGTENISSGALNIASGGTNTAGTLNLSGGSISNAGNLVVTNTETVSAGTLGISGTNTVGGFVLSGGTISGSGILTNSAIYDLQSGTVNIVLNGTSGLKKTGSGTVTLGAVNVYTGGTTISNGVLRYATNNALADAGAVTVSGGTLDLASYSDTVGAVTASGGNITGSGALTGSSYSLSNAASASNTISAVLAGAGALTKTGAGTYFLGNTNTYTGATAINAGVLAFSTSNAISTNSAVTVAATLDLGGYTNTFGGTNGVVTNYLTLNGGTITNGTLSLNNDLQVTNGGTISASITGAGGITNVVQTNAAATLLLSGSNNYTGVTSQRGATLKIGNAYALGATNGDTYVYGVAGGLDLNGYTVTGETMHLTNSSSYVTNSSADSATWAGNVQLESSSSGCFRLGAGAVTVSGTISGSASRILSKNGTGTLTLSASNAVQGIISVNEGTLKLGNANALGLVTTVSNLVVSNGAALDINGITANNVRVVNIAGTGVGGNGAIYNSSSSAATMSNAITLTNNTSVGAVGDMTLSGGISGAGFSVTKVGAGTVYLTGSTNSYSNTVISNGGLGISSSNNVGNGSITVAGTAPNTAKLINTVTSGISNAPASLALGAVTMNGNALLYLGNTYTKFDLTSLTLSGSTNQIGLSLTSGWEAPTDGNTNTYTLLSSTNSIAGGTNMSLLLGSSTVAIDGIGTYARNSYQFLYTNNNTYQMSVWGGAFNLVWNGSENNSWNTNSTNWNQSGDPANIAFVANDNVTFTNLGVTNIAVDAGGVTAGTMGVSNNAGNALTLSGGNATATLTVGSGGNLIVEGTLTPRGSVSVDAGTLQIGSGGATGALGNTNTIDLTNSGSFIVNLSTNYTLSNKVAGAGSLTKLGSGTTVLAVSNSYNGQTIVGAGTLQVGSAAAGAAVASAGTGDIVVSNTATLAFYRTNVYTNANNISGAGSVSQLGSQSLELAGSNTFSGGLYLNTNSSGTVWATNGTNLGTGTIYAVSANSKIGLSKIGMVTGDARDMTITNALSTSLSNISTDVLAFQPGGTGFFSNNVSITLSGPITGSGWLKVSGSTITNGSIDGTGTATLYVYGTNNTYSGGTEVANGRISVSNGSALGSGIILFSTTNPSYLQMRSNTTFSQNFVLGTTSTTSTNPANAVFDTMANTVTISGAISNRTSTNPGTLLKIGTGTLILSNTNTYTGGTVINQGTLASGVSNALADTGAITILGGTLDISSYSETVGAVTLSNGTIAGTTGVLTNSGLLAYGGSSISAILDGSGTLTKTSTGTLTLSAVNTYTGATVILDSGTLALTNAGSITNSSLVSITNGIFDISGVSGAGTSILALQAGTGTTSSEVALGSKTLTMGTTSASNIFNGRISGTGSVIKIGASTMTLYSNSTYSGGFTLSNGLIRIATSGALDGSGNISNSAFGTGTLTIAGGSIRSSGTSGRTIYNATRLANDFTLGDSTDNGEITFTTNTAGATTTLQANVTLTAVSGVNLNQSISGNYVLTKAGTGALNLGGSNANLGIFTNSTDASAWTATDAANVALVWNGNGALGYGSSNYPSSPWLGTNTITLADGSAFGQGGNMTNNTVAQRILSNNLVLAGNVSFGLGTYANYLGGNIDLGGATRTITLSNSTDVGGVISNGGLTIVSTSATRILTLTNSAATYAGATTVNGGVLALTNGGSLSSSTALNLAATTTNASFDISGITASGSTIGSLAGGASSSVILGAKNLTNGGDNTTSTFAGVASGTGGSLTKAGNGTLTLSGVNTYDGDTYVNAGTVKLSGSGAIAAGSGVVVTNGATFDFNSLSRTVDGISGAGTVTLGSATLTVSNSATNNFSGTLSGTGGLTKTGAGTQILTASNSYDGATAVSAGVLTISNGSALGSSTGGTTVAAGAALQLQGGITISGETLGLSGTNGATASLRSISGDNTYNGAITFSSGTNRIDSDAGLLTLSSFANSLTGTKSLLVGGAGNTTFSGRFTGSTTGTLTKDGAGTLTLAATNFDINGGVLVNAGTLALATNEAIGATTAITVSNATFNIGSYSNTMGAVTVTNGGQITGSGGTLTGSSYASGVVNATNTISANLAGSGGLTLTGNTNKTVLSGTNTYSGDTALNNTSSTNMLLRVNSTNALSANSSLIGASSAARTPTLDLAAAGNYKMQSYKGGNMIFLATNGDATISFTNTTATNQMTAGDKNFYATNVDVTFAGPLEVSPTSTNKDFGFRGNGDYTFSGSIVTTNTTYTANMVVDTTGIVTLNASNNYNGTTTVSSNATLLLGNNYALGTTNNGTTVNSGGTLDLGGASISSEALTIEGTGASSGGAIKNSISSAASWSGAVTLVAATTVSTTNGNITLSGAIGETGGTRHLIKTGSSTLTLSGSEANTYSGRTTVSGGSLQLNKTAGVNAIAGPVTVASGATLLLSTNNQVADTSAITLSGGTITRGSGVSEVFGNLDLSAGSFLDFGSGTGTGGDLTFGTYTPSYLLTVNNFFSGNTLIFGSDLTGSIAVGTYDTTSYTSQDGFFTINSISGGFTTSYSGGSFTITAIPETSTVMAAIGLVGLCLWPLRRRVWSAARGV